jgi:hypothetical protein
LYADGSSVFAEVIQKRQGFFAIHNGFMAGDCLTRELCCPRQDYSMKIRRFSVEKQEDLDIADLRDYDFVIVAAFNGYLEYACWLMEQRLRIPIILIQDDAVEEILYSHMSLQVIALRAMELCDGFIAYQEQMFSLARGICRDAIRVSHPMPPDFRPERGKRASSFVMCIGVGCWNYDLMNVVASVAILRRVRGEMREPIQGEFLGVHEYKLDEYSSALRGDGVVVWPWARHEGYYDALGRYEVVLNLNGRAAAGRVSAECALLGVPCVGNRLADMQEYCWPELSIEKCDVEKGAHLCVRLFNDRDFRSRQIESATQKVMGLRGDFYNVGGRVLEFVQGSAEGKVNREGRIWR